MAPVFIIGVAGGTASGKTTVCNKIMHDLQKSGEVALINQDSFYKALTEQQRADVVNYNFDHPDAMDHDALINVVQELREHRAAHVPIYDFVTHSRRPETHVVQPAEVVIIEGILVLAVEEVRALCNLKIFVETDDDVRLARRIVRDTAERGRDVAGVIQQYTRFVKPMYDAYVAPSRREADVIIPWSKGDNDQAIDLIVQHIRSKLSQGDLRTLFPNLKVTPSNFQVRAMQTLIRDRNTQGHDFVFYVDRLVRLVVEYGLGFLQYTEKEVETPLGDQYTVCQIQAMHVGHEMPMDMGKDVDSSSSSSGSRSRHSSGSSSVHSIIPRA